MLEGMKKGVGKIVMWVLGVLLIASFAVWGIGDMTGAISNPDSVASVAGKKISQREFQEQFRREMSQIRARIGEIDIEQARNLGIVQSTLNGLISRRLMTEQANDLGLAIGDEQIAARIRNEAAFRNELGQFDRARYQQVLANNGLTESSYVASLRNEIRQNLLASAISGGVSAPTALADTIYRFRNERRAADVVKIPRPALEAAPEPTDAQLTNYLNENSDIFMAPEYRRLMVLYLNPEEVAKELSPPADRIREEYEYRLPSLSIPERRQLEQILIRDEAAAKKAYDALSEGRTFEAVAEETTGKKGDDLKIGLVAKADMLPDLGDAAFAVEQGKFTQPIKSPLGWHIIRVAEIQPGHKPTFAEVEKEIAVDLAKELALDDLVKRANRIEDALAGGATIEEAAADSGAQLRKVEPIDAAKKLQSGKTADGLPDDPAFVETAFTTEKDATSRLTETSGGGYFMVRVDDVIAPAKRSLDQIRDLVTQQWKLQQLDEIARKKAEQVRDAVTAGKPLPTVAEEMRLVAEQAKPVSRFATAADNAVPRALVPDLFKAKEGGVVMGQTPDGYAVARLTRIESATAPSADADFERLKDTLSAAIATDLLQGYTQALRDEYSVSINNAGLEAFLATQQ